MNNEICLFGYSGHSYVIIDTLMKNGWKIKGYFNDKEIEYNPFNLSYLGFENDIDFVEKVGDAFVFPAMGSNRIRKKLITLFEELGLKQTTIIDNSATLSTLVKIDYSTFIGPNAVVNAFASIGKGVIINSQATIEHETSIDDYVHIAPGAVLCGNVSVGELSFVGANSVIRENINLGNNVIIGAGSVVINNQPDGNISFGNPAKKKV